MVHPAGLHEIDAVGQDRITAFVWFLLAVALDGTTAVMSVACTGPEPFCSRGRQPSSHGPHAPLVLWFAIG